jgi:acetyltransferase-like isoleucine patch superfamily enzyme
MDKYVPIADYNGRRPARLRWLGPFYKILNKLTRDWVFSWKMRNRLLRFTGVNLARDDREIFIGRETWIDDNFPELVTIEPGVCMGWRCAILVHNTQMMPPSVAPVSIGRKVLIGQGVTIMPGVTIGEYAQIGTGAVVTKDVEPYTVVVGVPAHPVRKLKQDEIDLRNNLVI